MLALALLATAQASVGAVAASAVMLRETGSTMVENAVPSKWRSPVPAAHRLVAEAAYRTQPSELSVSFLVQLLPSQCEMPLLPASQTSSLAVPNTALESGALPTWLQFCPLKWKIEP